MSEIIKRVLHFENRENFLKALMLLKKGYADSEKLIIIEEMEENVFLPPTK